MKNRIKRQLPDYEDHDIDDPDVDEAVRDQLVAIATDWFPRAPQAFVEAAAEEYGHLFLKLAGVRLEAGSNVVLELFEMILGQQRQQYRTGEDAARALAETIHGCARMVHLPAETLARSFNPEQFQRVMNETEFNGVR